ncbi:MAG TPA: hypothetical protein VMW34_01490 [Anaerolineales bacterium]|jgi:hypothetical protein|nr:hypothetical protein [Anaerolineales bacterium]
MKTDQQVHDWLLEENNPSIRYRTMTELLDRKKDDVEVVQAREQIFSSKMVSQILSKMHPDGYWLQKKPTTNELVGDSVEYGAYATTHFCLAYLAELGLDRQNPQVSKAADRYLNLQKADGDFYRHLSCLYGYNIRTFIMLGFRQDSRVQKSIELMLASERPDGGYLCDLHEGKYKNKFVKSCIRGSVKTLLAFSELQEYWDHPRCQLLVEYFMKRNVLFRTSDLEMAINHDVTRTSFPITWRAGLTEMVYALSKMGFGVNDELNQAWEILDSKRDIQGKYILDHTPAQALLKPGKKGEPNKWLTFYAMLAKKYKLRAHPSPASR